MIPIMNPIGMEYRELDGSPEVDCSINELQITRKFMVGWNYRKDFVNQCLGRRDVDQSAAICTNARVEKHPGITLQEYGYPAFCYYDHAIVTLTFSTDDPPIIYDSLEPSAEFITLPIDGLSWGSGGTALKDGENPGMLMPTTDYVVYLQNQKFVNPQLLAVVGKINSEEINPYEDWSTQLVNFKFRAETLLYLGSTINRSYSIIDDSITYQVTMRFTHRPNYDTVEELYRGWNWFYVPVENAWKQIYQGSNIINIYSSVDFKTALKPEEGEYQ